LVNKEDCSVQLDRNHAYYYQVQTQIHITEVEFCDFIVWNKNSLYIERIMPDVQLLEEISTKVETFFRQCILPEILGQKFTKVTKPPLLENTVLNA
jgi:hypothetical protein